jgi:hypothetical protein
MGTRQFDIESWSVVPGPLSIHPPFDSTESFAIEAYLPSAVAKLALALPSVELLHSDQPDWWHWVARWSVGSAHIDLAMTLLETTPETWGGFGLSGSASSAELLTLYRQIHRVIPGAWLHNSKCALHTAESFSATMAAA